MIQVEFHPIPHVDGTVVQTRVVLPFEGCEWCVHAERSLAAHEPGWVVSHLRSGHSLGAMCAKLVFKKAMEVAEALHYARDDWHVPGRNGTTLIRWSDDMSYDVLRILEPFGQAGHLAPPWDVGIKARFLARRAH